MYPFPRSEKPPEGEKPPSLRLFTAIAVPCAVSAGIRAVLAGYGELLGRLPETLHLTLRFLGEVPEPLVQELSQALRKAAGPPPPEIRLGPLGVFRRRGRSLLWAGLEPSGALSALKGKIDRALAGLPLPPPGKFTPHLTLARLKPGGPRPPEHPEALRPGGSFTAESFGLYSSLLRPEGALHSLLHEYPLK
ncbi:MAG: RNA 2',3'-cyclic phosphodiesterase [Deltaproteobacteria bacterium]|jgi:2'-5' RNA ligase|nr:RNA 2',3'-cyclic phosphodiesterase [Deltaproteobacteria bacterium]